MNPIPIPNPIKAPQPASEIPINFIKDANVIDDTRQVNAIITYSLAEIIIFSILIPKYVNNLFPKINSTYQKKQNTILTKLAKIIAG